VFGGGPCGLDGLVGEEGPVEDSGEVVRWSAGMVAEILEDTQVVVKVSHGHDVIDHVVVKAADVNLLLSFECLAGIGDLVAVVEVFDGLLEADGDQQADDDGGDVNEEVALGVGGVVWRVDVEHGAGS
jgi:hypothetical protein